MAKTHLKTNSIMFKSIILSICCTCFAATLFAAPQANDPLIVRTTSNTESVQLLLANLEGVTTNIELTSLDTKAVLLDEQIRKHNGFSYDLQLDELAQGRYLLKVTKGDEVRQQVILISEAGIFLSQIK